MKYSYWLNEFGILFTICISLSTTIAQAIEPGSNCQVTESPFCNIDGYYTWRQFNNTLGHNDLQAARSELNRYFFLTKLPECFKKVQLFLCSLYLPVCVDNSYLLPCRDICEVAYECKDQIEKFMNEKWPSQWNCSNFQSSKALQGLCVHVNGVNATGEPSFPSHPVPPEEEEIPKYFPEYTYTSTPSIHTNLCGPNLFDCHFSDPKHPMCIDESFVCDGKIDCVGRNASIEEKNQGFDEAGCPVQCADGQPNCDDKCIGKNGEQLCVDNTTTVIQSILCIIVMSSALAILIKLFQHSSTEDRKPEHNSFNQRSYEDPPPPRFSPPPVPTSVVSSHEEPALYNPRDILYQEPSILTTTRSIYEVIQGGHSGASSVYGFEQILEPIKEPPRVPRETPPPPPPTPSRQSILYENLDDCDLED